MVKFYSTYELERFAEDKIDRKTDELLEIYHNDQTEGHSEFVKKIRGIVIGVWQKYEAMGRYKQTELDRIIRAEAEFFCINNDLKGL